MILAIQPRSSKQKEPKMRKSTILFSVAILLLSSMAISPAPAAADVPNQAELCFDFWVFVLDLGVTWEQADEVYWACMGF